MAIIVTGGAGSIRSNFVLDGFNTSDEALANRDKLPSTRNRHNLVCPQLDAGSTSVRCAIFDFHYLLQSNPL
jgi:dTDP-D-glucose 4,6-dehydratase